jgi:TonB-linked SusC/RagA family outer membrane protein
MGKLKPLCMLLLVSLISVAGWGQRINGTVVDNSSGNPIEGASVIAGDRTAGVFTNAAGEFTIELDGADYFTVSSVGYAPQRVNVTGASSYIIRLEIRQSDLEQVVVVGYGTQTRANLTGAVSTVDVAATMQSRPITDVARGLQGTTPGLTITSPFGQPGVAAKISLRGLQGSLNATQGAKPLILVDNVEILDLQLVNPEDIESISVLKDAASASIYGTRATWGVILITTKSGRKNTDGKVTYSNNLSWNKPTIVPEPAEPVKGIETVLSALRRTSNNPNITQYGVLGMYFDEIGMEKIRNWVNTYGDGSGLGLEMVEGRDYEIRDGKLFFYRPWNPMKMYMKEYAFQQKHDISVNGGGDKTTYHLGLGYLNQGGVLKVNPDKFERYNLTLNLTTDVKEWMEARGRINLAQSTQTYPFQFSGASLGPWAYLTRWPAVYPYGTIDGKPFRSALTETAQAKMDTEKGTLAKVQVGTTLKPVKGLTLDADYIFSAWNEHIHSIGGGTSGIDFWGGSLTYRENYQSASYDRVMYTSWWSYMNTFKAFATYTTNIGNHNLKFIAGGDMDYFREWMQRSERRNIMDPNLGEPNLATGDQFVGGSRSHWATLGYFARVNYSYKNKYLLEFNGRYDGSSRFPTSDQYAFFPSASLGYVLSEENYMDFAKDVLSFLKIRASLGTLGNQDVGNNRFLSTMSSTNSGWLIGSVNQLTMSTPTPLSPILTWEKVTTLDFGVDARFFDNKLGIAFDWYRRTISDMITGGVTLPSTFGAASPVRNYGEMQTTGWELTADFRHSFNNGLNINVTGVLSDFQEKITRFANTTKTIGTNYEGRVLGEIWGYVTDRYFTADDFTGQQPNGKWIPKAGIPDQTWMEQGSAWFFYGPGDIKYKDLNGDGKIDAGSNTVNDPGDQKIIGNSTPRYQFGVTISADWKGFDLMAYFQGVGKRDYWPNGPVFIPGWRQAEVWYQHQMDYWTEDNPNAYYPRPTNYNEGVDGRKNFYPQTKYLLNMSYVKLKNLALGYTVPASLSSKLKLQKFRVYVATENLVTWSPIQVPVDPEIDYYPGQDSSGFGRTYPHQKRISVGVQATF